LDAEARAALAGKLRNRLSEAAVPAGQHDVVIMGGGVAGLTLGLEIRTARPETRVAIIA
jgi:ribulose 1,5-bisphosphate synthetase/thiazole synthase